MATVLDQLIAQGKALPMGVKPPKVTIWDALAKSGNDIFGEQQRKAQEQFTKEMEMYKTLRQAGYTAKEAYKAVKEGKLLEDAGEAPDLDKMKTEAEIERIKAGTAKANTPSMRDKIINKVALGETLTPGEQKVYDDIIKKQGGDDIVGGIIKMGAKGEEDEEDMVLVMSPDGMEGKVPRKNLQKFLDAGYTQL